MTREYLQKNGKLIDKVDFRDGGIYLYTNYYYMHDNCLFVSDEHSNQMRYTGKNSTYIVDDDVKGSVEKYDREHFTGYPFYLSDEGYDKLKEAISES